MTTRRRSIFIGGYAASLPLCLVLATGCSKPEAPPTQPSISTGAPPPGGMGSGGRRGPGGGGQPLAATATGAEIYQAKCGCHGDMGKGKNAPALASAANQPENVLFTTIHDGKGKMPAFASQLSDDQIKKVAATVKEFK